MDQQPDCTIRTRRRPRPRTTPLNVRKQWRRLERDRVNDAVEAQNRRLQQPVESTTRTRRRLRLTATSWTEDKPCYPILPTSELADSILVLLRRSGGWLSRRSHRLGALPVRARHAETHAAAHPMPHATTHAAAHPATLLAASIRRHHLATPLSDGHACEITDSVPIPVTPCVRCASGPRGLNLRIRLARILGECRQAHRNHANPQQRQ
jgi:hypothetical protein